MEEEKKPYVEDLKDTFQGIFILLIIGIAVLFISSLLSFGKEDDEYNYYEPPSEPTSEDYKRWNEEYERYGNRDPDIDVNQQYGGR